MKTKTPPAAVRQRILRSVRRTPAGCWLWTGATVWNPRRPQAPYGTLTLDGRSVTARRAAYAAWGRTPPLGSFTVGTTCGNSLCVNPDHLVRGRCRKSAGPPTKEERDAAAQRTQPDLFGAAPARARRRLPGD